MMIFALISKIMSYIGILTRKIVFSLVETREKSTIQLFSVLKIMISCFSGKLGVISWLLVCIEFEKFQLILPIEG